MVDEQQYSHEESSIISSSRSIRVTFAEQVGFSEQRMDLNSGVETELDEMQRIREGRAGSQIASRHVLEDEVRRVMILLRAEEDTASRIRGRGSDDFTRFRDEIGMIYGGCRGMTLAQVQSLEDRIVSKVEMRVATMFDRFAVSFKAKMALTFERLRTMGVSGDRRGYVLVPSAQASDKPYTTMTKPDEGTRDLLVSTVVANETIPDEDWSCVFCDLIFTSKESFEEHILKVRHNPRETASCSPNKRKILDNDEAMEKNSKSAKHDDVVGVSKSRQLTRTIEEPIDASPSVEHKGSQSKNGNININFWCETCHVQMNSKIVMEGHMKGKRHLKLSTKSPSNHEQGGR